MLLTLAGACLLIDDDAHPSRLADARSRSGEDSGSGDSAATDSGPPDTGRADTALADDWKGTYTGSFTLQIDGVVIDDRCEGDASFRVDAAADPAVLGEVTCTWRGGYAAYGGQSGSFEGVLSASEAVGAVRFGEGVTVADTWNGSLEAGPPAHLDGSFSGTTTCEGASCSYEGSFSAAREE